MSITASYRRLSPQEFNRLHADPEEAGRYFGDFLEDEDDAAWDAYLDARDADKCYLSIGNSWHGLHFLLTGDAAMDNVGQVPPPLGNVVQGGTATSWEATYGMVRSLAVEEVQDVANALEKWDEETLLSRFDVATFRTADIYPGGDVWDQTSWSYLYHAFTEVRDFFAAASAAGNMVLLSLD